MDQPRKVAQEHPTKGQIGAATVQVDHHQVGKLALLACVVLGAVGRTPSRTVGADRRIRSKRLCGKVFIHLPPSCPRLDVDRGQIVESSRAVGQSDQALDGLCAFWGAHRVPEVSFFDGVNARASALQPLMGRGQLRVEAADTGREFLGFWSMRLTSTAYFVPI